MKKFNFIIIVLFFLLFSCAGSPKAKDTENKETNKTAKQTNELAEKTQDYSVDEKSASEDLTAGDTEEPLNAETAQADSDKEKPVDETSLTVETETDVAREIATATPSVSQTPSAQTQPQMPPVQTQPQAPPAQTQTQTPSAQTQPQQPPQTQSQTSPVQTQSQTPPVQPPVEEETSVSESAPSEDDSQSEKEPSSSTAGGGSAPAPRIESVIQMGTMPHDNEIVFSRIVHATVGQIVEIPFRGNGWVYLGEITSQRGIVFNSRRNDSDGQTYIFTLEEVGTYVLKFYRQNFIRGYILNDHVQVVAGEAPTVVAGWFNPLVDRGRVVAQPRWPSAVEETRIRSGVKPASEPVVTSSTAEESAKETTPAQSAEPQRRPVTETENTPQRTTPATSTNTQDRTPSQNNTAPPSSAASSGQTATAVQPAAQIAQTVPPSAVGQSAGESPSVEKKEMLAPEIIMQKARENFDGGNISAAIALLDQFMADYPGGSDEVYWQLGQYYEANSPSRNILLSLDYYRRLVNEYPQSGHFSDARRRIAYLERYYINIQ